MTDVQDRFYLPAELAVMLGESRQNVYRWIKRGLIRAVWHGWKLKIPPDEVRRVMSSGMSRKATGDN